MANWIKPDETVAESKRARFSIFTDDGLITDAEAFGLGGARLNWAANTFAPGASDLKVGYDNVASNNYGGTFAYRKNGEWYYEFSNAEVAASLGAKTVYFEFAKAGYRSFVVRLDLRYDVQNISTGAVTTIQTDLATVANQTTILTNLATIAGYIDTEVGSIYTVVTNLSSNLSTANLRLVKALGLLHLNSVIDEHEFDENDLLVSARLRVFADATVAQSAITDEPDDDHGETHRFAITAVESDDDDGKPKRYQLVEEVVAGS